MRVGLALEIDSTLDHLASVVAEIDRAFKSFFSDREYGNDVENIFVGIILTGPGSERTHPVRKLRYKKVHKVRIPGNQIELRNVVEYDIKPDFESFRQADIGEARRQLANELVGSLPILEKHQSKFPEFDVASFRSDVRACLDRLTK